MADRSHQSLAKLPPAASWLLLHCVLDDDSTSRPSAVLLTCSVVLLLTDVFYWCHVQIIVPMPCFDSQTRKPLAKTPKEKEKVG